MSLVPKVGCPFMPKGELSIYKGFHRRGSSFLCEQGLDQICATCLGRMFDLHLHLDLWMSKGAHNVSAVVVNFLSTNSKPKHITIGLFEANNIILFFSNAHLLYLQRDFFRHSF